MVCHPSYSALENVRLDNFQRQAEGMGRMWGRNMRIPNSFPLCLGSRILFITWKETSTTWWACWEENIFIFQKKGKIWHFSLFPSAVFKLQILAWLHHGLKFTKIHILLTCSCGNALLGDTRDVTLLKKNSCILEFFVFDNIRSLQFLDFGSLLRILAQLEAVLVWAEVEEIPFRGTQRDPSSSKQTVPPAMSGASSSFPKLIKNIYFDKVTALG